MTANSRGQKNLCLALLVAVLAASHAGAQLPDFGTFGKLGSGLGGRQKEEVTVSAEFTEATADRPALVFVTAKIAPGYHVYAVDQGVLPDEGGPQATKITLAEDSPVKLAGEFRAIQAPKTHIDDLAWKGLELREHEKQVTWFAPLDVPAGVNLSDVEIEGSVDGQACNPKMCVPIEIPFTAELGDGVPLPANVRFGAAAAASRVAPTPAPTPPGANAPSQPPPAEGSLGLFVLTGILGGLILNLMPCVLPVIGLKVLSFAKQGGQSRGRILALNVSYSAGLFTVFMVLATLAALAQLGLAGESFGWGELYTLTWFKVAMTGLVFAMALAFLGVWEVPIPGFATSGKATELTQQEGPLGAFCMGVFTTLLATPCSGPFLGPVFGFTLSQPPIVTYIVFASVGFGMALPYLLIGIFPELVSWLPKPGAWMETLKELLAFVLLATVVYLFSTISSDYHLATLALLFSIWFGCWIVGRTPLTAEPADRVKGWIRGVVAATAVGWASYAMLTPSAAELNWQPYSPEALAAARSEGKTVLVDFTANWCLTCKTNLKVAINRQDVLKLVERNGVVAMIADWTDKSDTIKQALAELNSRSIPLMAIYPAGGDSPLVLPDLLTQGRVLEALEAAGPSQGAKVDGVRREQPVATSPETPEFGARRRATVLQ